MSRIVTSLFMLLVVSFTLLACVNNQAAPAAGAMPRDVIVVVGEGEVVGKPDVARLELGVEARAPDAASAVAAINGKVQAMIEALKQLGIAAEDLQTRDFNIHSEQPEPEPLVVEQPSAPVTKPRPLPKAAPAAAAESTMVEAQAAPPKPRPMALVFRASNTLHVTVRDLDRLGEVLSRAVEAGANRAWGISFEIDDDSPLAQQARAKAVAGARAQAAQLAELAGVTLGPVVSITEAGTGGPTPAMGQGFAMAEMRAVPMESGQLAVRRQVQVVFAIERAR